MLNGIATITVCERDLYIVCHNMHDVLHTLESCVLAHTTGSSQNAHLLCECFRCAVSVPGVF